MDFQLTDEQLAIQQTVREFVKKEITPFIAEREKSGQFKADIFKKMGKLGFFGCLFPPEYGGTGQGLLTQVLIMEEFSRGSIETATGWNTQAVNVPVSIYFYGTEEQKRKYLPKIISAEMLTCFSLTEPDGGSDVANLKMRATRNEDGYVLNGVKSWATMGSAADLILLFAKTDPSAGGKGLSAFIVETANLKGFTAKPIPSTIGTSVIPTCELIFEDCQIPADSLLGSEGEGMQIALATMQYGRVCGSSRNLGVSQAALDHCLQYVQERYAFGKPIAQYQAIQHLIAEMTVLVDAVRLMVYRAAWTADQGLPFGRVASIGKYYASEMSPKITDMAMEIYGANGFANEYPVNRFLMMSRVFRVGEGAPNIQRNLIAQDALGWKKMDRYFDKTKTL